MALGFALKLSKHWVKLVVAATRDVKDKRRSSLRAGIGFISSEEGNGGKVEVDDSPHIYQALSEVKGAGVG